MDKNADENAIKKAYRKLAIKWHPVSDNKNEKNNFVFRTKTLVKKKKHKRHSKKLERLIQCSLIQKRKPSSTSMERQVSSKEAVAEEEIPLQTSGDLVALAVQVGEVASLSLRQTTFSNNSSEDATHLRTSSTMTSWEEDSEADRRNSPMEIKDETHSGWAVVLEVDFSMTMTILGLEDSVVDRACSSRCRWVEAWAEAVSLSSRPPHFHQAGLLSQYRLRRILRTASA